MAGAWIARLSLIVGALGLLSLSDSRAQSDYINKDIINTSGSPQVGLKVEFTEPEFVVTTFNGRFTKVQFDTPPGNGKPTRTICWTDPDGPIRDGQGVHVGWETLTPATILSMTWTDAECHPVQGTLWNIQAGREFGGAEGRQGGHAHWGHGFLVDGEPGPPITLSDIRYRASNECIPLAQLNSDNAELNASLLPLAGTTTLEFGEGAGWRIPGGVRPGQLLYLRYDVAGLTGLPARDWTRHDPFVWKWDWPDYARGGIPDFSQDHLGFPTDNDGRTTYDGPSALANCFWWFDSKMEGRCGGAPGDGADDYALVTRYTGSSDDHAPLNADPLIRDLAACMQTDQAGSGTRMVNMEACASQWLASRGQAGLYTVRRVSAPTFDRIACEVERSENVILQLGFWSRATNGGPWTRCGGHYVTSAGVGFLRDPGPDGQPGVALFDDDNDGQTDEPDELCPCGPGGAPALGDDRCGNSDATAFCGVIDRIAVSDPGKNNAERPPVGNGAAGRVRGPGHGNHAPGLPPPSHDDTQNASHDVYDVVPSVTGLYNSALGWYGTDGPGDPTRCVDVARWCGQNPSENAVPMVSCTGNAGESIAVEIESMLDISPVITDVCLDVSAGVDELRLHRGACPGPSVTTSSFDYIRGELCQLGGTSSAVSLGEVDCLSENDRRDQHLDRQTWDITRGIDAWFYLVREEPATNYGASSDGRPRRAASGECP